MPQIISAQLAEAQLAEAPLAGGIATSTGTGGGGTAKILLLAVQWTGGMKNLSGGMNG